MLSDVFSWAHSTHLVNRVDYRRALPIFRITSTYRADGTGQVGSGSQVGIHHYDQIWLAAVKPQPPAIFIPLGIIATAGLYMAAFVLTLSTSGWNGMSDSGMDDT